MSYEATYKLWYEFLRRTDPNNWSGESEDGKQNVKKDFAGTDKQDFETWLDGDKRMRMFAPYGPIDDPKTAKNRPVRHVSKGQGIEDVNHETHIVLVIDIREPVSTLIENIERMVKLATETWWLDHVWWNDKHKGSKSRVGRTKWEKNKALYPLEMRPDIEALELTLLIHDIDQFAKQEDWPHWKTGVEAKEINSAFLPLMKYGNDGPDADQKIELSNAVIRILDRAEKIKAGVVKGIFPAS